jgi:hypothetical protein
MVPRSSSGFLGFLGVDPLPSIHPEELRGMDLLPSIHPEELRGTLE